jgi:hypothetical protein
MDINTQNSSGMMNGMPPTPRTDKKVGPIVGALIIVLVLIIAALYFFGQKLNTELAPQESPITESIADNMTATASQADDVSTLEKELSEELPNIDYSF